MKLSKETLNYTTAIDKLKFSNIALINEAL